MASTSSSNNKISPTKNTCKAKRLKASERETRKHLRLSGKQYTNSKGKIMEAKTIGDDCKCRRKCYENVPENVRSELFQDFYSLKSHSEQNAYLFPLIRRTEIQRKRNKASNRRSCTFNYYVCNLEREEVQICREAFAKIHGISMQKIRVLCGKIAQNVEYPNDERGRHLNRPHKLSAQTIQLIRNHIQSIMESDKLSEFTQAQGRQTSVGLSISKMWKHFCQYGNSGFKAKSMEPVIKSWVYYRVFNELASTKYAGMKVNANASDEMSCEQTTTLLPALSPDIHSVASYSEVSSCVDVTTSLFEPSTTFSELNSVTVTLPSDSDYVYNFDNPQKFGDDNCLMYSSMTADLL